MADTDPKVSKDASAPVLQQQHHPHQHQHRSHSQPHMHLNMFNTLLPSDMSETVGRFIAKHCHTPCVEFEGKLGLICNRDGNAGALSRLFLGVKGATPLRSEHHNTRFKSGIDKHAFQHLNVLMNSWYTAAHAQAGLSYKRTKEMDHFYKDHVRVSVNSDTKEVIRSIQKRHLENLEIHMPACPYDIRISANQEFPVDKPNSPCVMIRMKNRVSYNFAIWSVDLTEVKTWNHMTMDNCPSGDPTNTYELEIEITDVALLDRYIRNHQYPALWEICKCWLNNLALCARHSDSRQPLPRICRAAGTQAHSHQRSSAPTVDPADEDKATRKRQRLETESS